jgi:Domain of unknown function (DUF397)
VQELDLKDARWRKSRRSSGNGQCVEVARLSQTVAVRDSKDPDGPKLLVSVALWRAFISATKDSRNG